MPGCFPQAPFLVKRQTVPHKRILGGMAGGTGRNVNRQEEERGQEVTVEAVAVAALGEVKERSPARATVGAAVMVEIGMGGECMYEIAPGEEEEKEFTYLES